MISKYPSLPEYRVAARVRALKPLNGIFFMCGEVVGEVLGHFEALIAPWESALVESHAEMAFKVLSLL